MFKKILTLSLLAGAIIFSGCQTTLDEGITTEVTETVSIDAIIASSVLQYPANNDLFYYNVYDEYVSITKYLGDETLIKKEDGFVVPTEVAIPDMIDGLPVYTIGPNAFEGATFETVAISKNIVSIGDSAFYNCKNLKSVTFVDVKETNENMTQGDGVVTIGANAFSGCEKLENIKLPDSVETIGESAFYACESLTKINVPKLITYVPKGFCQKCTSLKEIYIADSVTEIENTAFAEVARDARIYGGVYSQSAHYAANNFMLFVINREKEEIKINDSILEEKKEEGNLDNGEQGAES